MNNDEVLERVVALEVEKKSQDREIKELKEKVEVLTTSFNGLALAIQGMSSKMDNLTEKLKPISDYIEDLKTQPRKELNKFAWLIATLVTNAIWGAILFYFKK